MPSLGKEWEQLSPHSNGAAKTGGRADAQKTVFNGINLSRVPLPQANVTVYVSEISALKVVCSLLPVFWRIVCMCVCVVGWGGDSNTWFSEQAEF